MSDEIGTMLLRPWFLGAVGLALIHQILQKILGIHVPIVDSYLDPLLFLPILLQLILLERRFVFGKGSQYALSWYHIFGVVVLVSVLVELLFPVWNPLLTADYKDVICYLIGGTAFGVFFNVPNRAFRSIKEMETGALLSNKKQ